MKSFKVLLKTELILSVREFSGIFFGIIFPLGVVLLMGAIFGDQLAYTGASYTMMQQSFGGFIAIAICATGLMGVPLNIANYREKKILKRLKVTPINPTQLLVAQVVVSFLVALVSAMLVFIVSKVVFNYTMVGSWLSFLLGYLLVLIAIYSLGMLIASIAPNLKTVNLLCNLVYFPMLLLSGTTVPYEIMPKGLQIVADVLPLTQGIKLLKGISLNLPLSGYSMPIIILVLTSIIGISLSFKFFSWE